MGQYQKQYQGFPADERALLAQLVEESDQERREWALSEYSRIRACKCQRQ